MPMNRRSFMKASGLAATMGVTALAGCNGILGGGGSGAANWQYDPAELSETQTRFFGSMQYGDLYEMRDELPASMSEGFQTDSSSPVNPEDLDVLSGVGGGQVSMETQTGAFFGSLAVTGSFDTEAMGSEIESGGQATQSGEYEGYTLYEGANLGENVPGQSMPGQPGMDASATVALSSDAIVFGVTVDQTDSLEVTGQQTVETMIDANAGNAPLYADNSDHASELQNKLGDATMVVGGEVEAALVDLAEQQAGAGMGAQMLSGVRAGGFSGDIAPDTTTYTFAIVYESSTAAEDSGLVGLVNMASQQATESPEINSIDANRDGSTVVVTVEGDTQALLSQGQNQVPMGSVNAVPTGY
jgi:hypothetical protein